MTAAFRTMLAPAARSVGLFVIVTTAFRAPQATSEATATSNAELQIHCVFMHTFYDHVPFCGHFLLPNTDERSWGQACGPDFLFDSHRRSGVISLPLAATLCLFVL